MTHVVILSALQLRRATALSRYIDQFTEAGATQVSVITLGPLSHWRDEDPTAHVLDPTIQRRRGGRNPWHKSKVARLTLRGPRWHMNRLLRKDRIARELLASADIVYVDQPTAVLAAWHAARAQGTVPYVTSTTRVLQMLQSSSANAA
ncbi:hypothetical protein [Demequina globuliformis]|uniref:hypothetical protein n=1 Tax=Demequina globuliformis TaxID=676202 RepID=UPI0007836440|nr:hypothetical protein [Demequina globuliformis]